MKNIGIVGLGNMGRGMAVSLLRADYDVVGFDPSLPEPPHFEDRVATMVTSPADVARTCDVMLLSLPTAAVVEQVIEGADGILSAERTGLTIIDTSTSHPDTTRRLAARLSGAGIALIDAPVSGGPAGALSGALGMVLGGAPEDIARAMPVLEAISAVRTHVGGAGDGHALKIINNALCAANLILAAEAVSLGRRFGMVAARVIAGLNSGSGRNAATEINFPRWVLNDAFDSGFTMKLMRKDIRLAADLVERSARPYPLLQHVIGAWAGSAATIPDEADFNRIVDLTFSQDHPGTAEQP